VALARDERKRGTSTETWPGREAERSKKDGSGVCSAALFSASVARAMLGCYVARRSCPSGGGSPPNRPGETTILYGKIHGVAKIDGDGEGQEERGSEHERQDCLLAEGG
jgi:hypothetical protein